MKSIRHFFLPFVVLTAILLGACTFPIFHSPAVGVNIFHPQAGMIMPLGASVSIKARVDPGTGLNNLIFFANGRTIGEIGGPAVGGDGAIGTGLDWTPGAPGEYQLQVDAVAHGGGGDISDPVRICVLDPRLFSGFSRLDFTPAGSYGYDGPCDIPPPHPFDPSTPPDSPVTLYAVSYPDPVVLSFESATGCPSPVGPTRLLIMADTDDPADRTAFVIVHLQSPALTVSDTFHLSSGTPGPGVLVDIGSRRWIGASDDFGPELSSYAASARTTAVTIVWTAYAIGRDGSILATSGPHYVTANACGPVPLSAPFTLTTATPASALDCPAGTFFAEQTHKCIPIQIKTPKSGGSQGGSCADFANPSACTSNGCSWDKITSTCY